MSRKSKQKQAKNDLEKGNKISQSSSVNSMMQRVFDIISRPFRWISKKLSLPPARSTEQESPSYIESEPIQPPPVAKRKLKNKTGQYTINQEVDLLPPVPKPRVSLQPTTLVPSSRVPQCAFLFLGLDMAGISSTISNLFKVNQKENKRMLSIREISERVSAPTPQDKVDLKIIDAPGLCKGDHLEQDAEIVIALKNHLKQSLPNQIPNVTFLVTRFDDNRFEGEASQLTKMFTALSHSRKSWTDSKLTNIILVLTHCQKVRSEYEDIGEKIIRFQQALHNIFPPSNNDQNHLALVPCVLVDNLDDPLESQKRLLFAISKVVKARSDSSISQKFLNHIKQRPKSIFDSPKDTLYSIESLLPNGRREVNKLLNLLLQGQSYQDEVDSSSEDSNSEEEVEIEFRPYRVDYFPKLIVIDEAINPLLTVGLIPPPPSYRIESSSPTSLNTTISEYVTILPPNSKLMLADGTTEMLVQHLNVGDKLLDKDLKYNVIISIKTAMINSNNFEGKWVGRIYVEEHYCQEDSDLSDDNDNESLSNQGMNILRYKGGKVRPEELKMDTTTLDPVEKHLFFILQLDKSDGTFIADGHVMYHEHAAPNFNGSRTKL